MLEILFNALSFIIIISILAFIHEFGHYIIAKISGVKIETFSIGFGPKLLVGKDKSGTDWCISAFPIGGYVKMFGDSNAASMPDSNQLTKLTAEQQKLAFHYKPLYIKFLIVAAGPMFNFIFAIIILSGMYNYYGKSYALPMVGMVQAESAAEKAGLKIGDIITNIEGHSIDDFADIARITSLNPGTKLLFTIKRDDELEFKKYITIGTKNEDLDNGIKVGILGIGPGSVSYRKYDLPSSIYKATIETWKITALTFSTLKQMITGKRGTEEISGPIRIAQYSGKFVRHGMEITLYFMAIISINLGLMNLLPVPILDGGHLLYYGIEAITGKPLADKVQQYGFKIGMVLIICLMIFSTFNDLKFIKLF